MNQTIMAGVLSRIKSRPGSENSILMRDLAASVGVSTREVQAVVMRLRRDGFPILSQIRAPYGYFWPASVSDGAAFQRQMENRAKSDFAAVRNVNAGLRRLFGDDPQLRLGLDLKEA